MSENVKVTDGPIGPMPMDTAFPCRIDWGPMGGTWTSAGMTLRDYFAGQAPMSDQAWRALIDIAREHFMDSGEQPWPELMAKQLAEWAYTYADAMLRERAKQP